MSAETIPALLPCPFCGGPASVWPDEVASGGQHVSPYWAGCPMPRGCGVSFQGEYPDEAATAWNTRSTRPSEPVSAPAVGGDGVAAMRAAGWMVAVHNDYRLNGEAHTFWLWTKDGRAVKGEGRTDADALRTAMAEAGVTAPNGGDQEVEAVAGDAADLTSAYMAGFERGKDAERAAHEETKRERIADLKLLEAELEGKSDMLRKANDEIARLGKPQNDAVAPWQALLMGAQQRADRAEAALADRDATIAKLEDALRVAAEDERDRLRVMAIRTGAYEAECFLIRQDGLLPLERAALRSRTPAPSRNQDGET